MVFLAVPYVSVTSFSCCYRISHCMQRAMEIAVGPGKNVLMNGFMMYMSGASINMISIMITFMGIMNPVKAIVNVHGGEKRQGFVWRPPLEGFPSESFQFFRVTQSFR